MSSHIVFHSNDRSRIFTLFQHKKTYHDITFIPKLPHSANLSIEITRDAVHKSKIWVTLRKINLSQVISSMFFPILYTADFQNVFFSTKQIVQIEGKTGYFNMQFQFNMVESFGLYLFYLPEMTKEVVFQAESHNEHQIVNFKSNYKIEISLRTKKKYSLPRNVNAELIAPSIPFGDQIFVVKVVERDSVRLFFSQTQEITFSSSSTMSIYCGVIDCIYPFLNQENQLFNILPLPFDKFEYMPIKNVYQMTDFSVRFGYDQLSASIVFEFILREENQSKYESIGVELSTKFGRCFKYSFGLITDTKPLIVRFTPIDLQRIGRFDRNISIGFSRYQSTDLVKIPSSYLQPYQSNACDKSDYMPIENVYQMTYFSVRFSVRYDQLSASIVFEFILRVKNQSKYESIGVELSTKFGRCFKNVFGLITDTKPLIVQFTSIDIQRIGGFDRNTSIRFSCYSSTDLVKIPSSYLQPYQSIPSAELAFSFLPLFFKLFIIHPEYFKDDIRQFIIRFSQNPTEFTILDFNIVFWESLQGWTGNIIDSLKQFLDKCQKYQDSHNILLYRSGKNDLIRPEKLAKPKYEIYFIQYIEPTSDADQNNSKSFIDFVIYIKKEETPIKIPFIEFYKKSKENDKLLYHFTRPLMPLSTYPEILSFKEPQFGFTNSNEKLLVHHQNPNVEIPREKNENTSKSHMSVFSYCQLEDSIVQDMSKDVKTLSNNSNDDLIPEIKFVAPKREEEASKIENDDSKNETENKEEIVEEEEDVENVEEEEVVENVEEEEDVENEEEEEEEGVENEEEEDVEIVEEEDVEIVEEEEGVENEEEEGVENEEEEGVENEEEEGVENEEEEDVEIVEKEEEAENVDND